MVLARQIEHPRLLGAILLDLGITYLGDSNSHVATYLQEALTIQRELGNCTAEQRILLYLGINCTQLEEYEAGRTYQLAALNLLSVTGNNRQQTASKLTDSHLLQCFWQAPAHQEIRALMQRVA